MWNQEHSLWSLSTLTSPMKYHSWVSFVLLDNRQNCLCSFYRKLLHEFIKGQGTKARYVHYWLVTREWLAWCQSPLSQFIYGNFNCSLLILIMANLPQLLVKELISELSSFRKFYFYIFKNIHWVTVDWNIRGCLIIG